MTQGTHHVVEFSFSKRRLMTMAHHVRNPLLALTARQPVGLNFADKFVQGSIGGGAHEHAEVVHVPGDVG